MTGATLGQDRGIKAVLGVRGYTQQGATTSMAASEVRIAGQHIFADATFIRRSAHTWTMRRMHVVRFEFVGPIELCAEDTGGSIYLGRYPLITFDGLHVTAHIMIAQQSRHDERWKVEGHERRFDTLVLRAAS